MKKILQFYCLIGLLFCFVQTHLKGQDRNLHTYVRLDKYCDGDAYATVTVSGNKRGYRFNWLYNNATEATVHIPGSLFGTQICVERICPCGKRDTVCFVFDPGQYEKIELNGSARDASCHGRPDGSIEVNGNSGNLSYRWNNGGNGAQIGNLAAGVYTVTATDRLGCTATSSFAIREPRPVTEVQIVTTQTNCPNTADGQAYIDGVAAGAAVAWASGTGNGNAVSGLAPGVHQVQVSMGDRCSTIPFTIHSPKAPDINAELTKPVRCHGERNAALEIKISGGGKAPFIANFEDQVKNLEENETMVVSGLGAGAYNIQVTDAKGCITYKTITINQPEPLTAAVQIPNHHGYSIGCNGGKAEVSFIASGGNNGYHTRWKKGNELITDGSTAAELEPGRYTAVVSDSKGCEFNQSFEVTEPEKIRILMKKVKSNRMFSIYRFNGKGGAGQLKLSKKWAVAFGNKKLEVTATDENKCVKSQRFRLKTITPPGPRWDSTPKIIANKLMLCFDGSGIKGAKMGVRRNLRPSGARLAR